jgi:hypothetical protein
MNTLEEAIKILEALRDGVTVQWKSSGKWHDYRPEVERIPRFDADHRYRIKPYKPRTGIFPHAGRSNRDIDCMVSAIELTPEVEKALKDAGIEYDG